MLSQPRTARKTASNSWRRSESGTARMRMTIGLTLRRTARRINRLKGACMLIPSGYLPPCHQGPPTCCCSPGSRRYRKFDSYLIESSVWAQRKEKLLAQSEPSLDCETYLNERKR